MTKQTKSAVQHHRVGTQDHHGQSQCRQALPSSNLMSQRSCEGSGDSMTQHRQQLRDPVPASQPQDTEEQMPAAATAETLPSVNKYADPVSFRLAVREGRFRGPTNSICPGYLQINLVVLPAGPIAFDFLLFCQRNSKACPLLEVCEGARSFVPKKLATGADLRTDIPK